MRTVSGAGISKGRRWAGRIMAGIAALFLLMDGVVKVLRLAPAVEGTTQLGYPASAAVPIGIIELACLALYVIPRTSILGAVLLTGYLGGAVATHVLFPIYVAVLIWGALFLLDERARVALSPQRP